MLNLTPARVLRAGFLCALSALTVMPSSAASRFVAAGGDLQSALDQATGGDTITLAANAKFTGHFTLAVNNSGQWITIQSSAMSNLPGAGQRVSPAQAQYMPKIVTPDENSTLVIPSGANFYRIQGVEFTAASGVYVQDLIRAGTSYETSVSQLAHDIDFDRDYIHGDIVGGGGGKRGIALNDIATTIENSYFEGFISDWQDTQAIAGWNGPGPFTIQNNHLEAGTEILAFGGAVPAINGLVPSNILVQNNEFYKPTRYYTGSPDYAGFRVWAKNHIELKNAQNVLIQNNTFTNNFVQADQRGFVLVLNVRDEYGQVPWATVSNVTVKNNLLQHIAAGVLFLGHDDGDNGGTAGNFHLSNNVYEDMGVYGGDGRLYQILNGVNGITIDHETAFPTCWLMVFDFMPSSNIKVTNSIFANGWGIAGDGTLQGNPTLAYYDQGGSFVNNVVISGDATQYAGSYFANNAFPGSATGVGFVNYNGNNFLLAANSSFKGKATDGLDLGSNLQSMTGTLTTPTGWVKVVSKNSGKCLDITGISTAPGAPLQQWTCTGGDNQKFQFTPVPGGYKVTAKNSGLQLDVWGGPNATQDGPAIKQWPYWGGANEIFQVSQEMDGYYTIHPADSGKCFDVSGISKNDGAPVTQWTCWGGDNQKWSFIPVQ
ncbi:MAG: RICIN domain-containing protein [Acidobacteriaceae bacterium]|nr:RICIN domain-containing protein [Acidobacteriaceae bacterium]